MILKGKRAVVTGSNSGIGLGVAVELAKAGAEVVINSFTDRPEDHALAAQIAADTGANALHSAPGQLGKQAQHPDHQGAQRHQKNRIPHQNACLERPHDLRPVVTLKRDRLLNCKI